MSPGSFYRIDLPAAAWHGEVKLEPVLPASPKKLRTHVERFARYFLREMHFNGIQFEAAETEASVGYVPYKAYLFARHGKYIGAGCFRFRDDQNLKVPWLFDWLWLHPFCRQQGHLSRVWPELQRQVDQFRCAKPLSLPMERFLSKVGWREAP